MKRGLKALKTLSFICSGQWKVENRVLVMFSLERRNFNGQFFTFLRGAKISSEDFNTPKNIEVTDDDDDIDNDGGDDDDYNDDDGDSDNDGDADDVTDDDVDGDDDDDVDMDDDDNAAVATCLMLTKMMMMMREWTRRMQTMSQAIRSTSRPRVLQEKEKEKSN